MSKRAIKIASVCYGGQILISETVFQKVKNFIGFLKNPIVKELGILIF